MKTAVVVLNWNTEEFLERFLPSLIASTEGVEGGAEVIVVDNASIDGSLKVMKEKFPSVRTISFEHNLGFTGGYNRSLAMVDAEYQVLINSDIEVPANWLGPLVRWMDTHPDCGACAPKLHSWYDRDSFEYAGAAGGYIDRFGYPFCRGRIMKRVEMDKGQYDSPAEVMWATGACLMVRSEVYRKLGGLDERFFAHMEEIDLCWRMHLYGHKVWVVPESVVYHLGGGTLPNTSPRKLFFNFRNNLMMLQNNLAKTYGLSLVKGGMLPEKAAEVALKKANRTIRIRMGLDLMSAAAYLILLKYRYFQSVLKAHREYRKFAMSQTKCNLVCYLNLFADKAEVKGIYSRWIIPIAFLKGKDVFGAIKQDKFLTL